MTSIIGQSLQPLDQNNPLRINDSELRQAIAAVYSRGAFALNARTYTDDVTLDHRISTVLCDTTGGAFTVTLPYANYWGENKTPKILFAHIAGANDVTISPAGSDTINGNASYTLSSGERIDLVSDGDSKWYVFAASSSGGPFVDESGDTMTGNLTISGADLIVGSATSTDARLEVTSSAVTRAALALSDGVHYTLSVGRWSGHATNTGVQIMATLGSQRLALGVNGQERVVLGHTTDAAGSYTFANSSFRYGSTFATGGVEWRGWTDETNDLIAFQSVNTNVANVDLLLQPGGGSVGIRSRTTGWTSTAIPFHVGQYVSLSGLSSGDDLHLTNNAYWNGTNWIRIKAAEAFNYYQADGDHRFRYSASGSAGGTITWTNVLTLNEDDYIQAHLPHSTPREISVHAHGAVGDYDPATGNGTDDQTAIQNALNTAFAAGGGVVTLEPNKKYRINSALTIPVGVTLKGSHENIGSGFRGESGYSNTNPATAPTLAYQDMGSSIWVCFDTATYGEFTSITADSGTDTFTCTGHGMANGSTVIFPSGTGTVPTGITADTTYYVINAAANTFQVSATDGGSAINFSTNGSGFKCLYTSYDVVGLTNFSTRTAAIYVRGKIKGVLVFQKNFKNGMHSQSTDQAQWYALQSDTSTGGFPVFCGLALRADAEDSCVEDCFVGGFMQAYLSYNESRPRLHNFFFDCINGVEISSCFDVAYLNNVQGFVFATTGYSLGSTLRRGTFMWLHDTVDWPKLSNCFTYGHKNGFYFANIKGLEATNCAADNQNSETTGFYGFRVIQSCQEITLTNCKFDNREYGAYIDVSSGNQVTLTGFRGGGTNSYGVYGVSGNITVLGAELSSSTTHFHDAGATSFVVVGPTCTGAGAFTSGDVTAYLHGQIQFPATQSASTDLNTLDDYEEGLWTPNPLFGGANTGATFSVRGGTYTKIGNRVMASGRIVFTAKGSSTGAATIGGLPFTVSNEQGGFAGVHLWMSGVTFANQFQGYALINSTSLTLQEVTEAGVVTNLDDTNFSNTSDLRFSVTYKVA